MEAAGCQQQHQYRRDRLDFYVSPWLELRELHDLLLEEINTNTLHISYVKLQFDSERIELNGIFLNR